ncbi:MAG TPA: hypothetical protein EYP80_01335 [Candidatus Aenigmarchaeota archaeon]|nr:hypothetical protein [Candidatus Aenigmarchaeota archaeon]
MFRKNLLIISGILFFLGSLNLAEATEKFKPIGPMGPRIEVPDQPVIKEFSVNPQITVTGESVTVRWKVEPGPGGSPITRVTIASGVAIVYRGNDLSGERSITLGNPGNIPLAISVENQIGNKVERSIFFQLISLDDLRRQISLQEITTRPSPVVGDRTTFDFNIRINNRSGVRINTLQIRVLQTDDPSGRTGTVIADKGGLTFMPGLNGYHLNSDGFDSSYGSQLFVILLYGTAVPKQELDKIRVNFQIRPVSINSYTVRAYGDLI